MNWLFLLAAVPFLLLLKHCNALYANYRRACGTGLPIVICPIDPKGLIWMLGYRRLIPFIEKLPSSWRRFTRYSYVGWTFDDKYASQKELGEAFLLATPGENELFVNDAGVIDAILSSPKDYPKPTALYRESSLQELIMIS